MFSCCTCQPVTFLLHDQVSYVLGLGQVSIHTDGFENGIHAGAEHQLQHHWGVGGRGTGVSVSGRHLHARKHTPKGTRSLPGLTPRDGELAVPEHAALRLVEGQVVEGGGHVHHQLLAVLHRPEFCGRETGYVALLWTKKKQESS